MFLLVVNHDLAVPVPGDGNFENYTKYLSVLNQRAIGAINAICQTWKTTSSANSKPRRIIVIRNSLFWLSLMRSRQPVDVSELIAREREATETLKAEVCWTAEPPALGTLQATPMRCIASLLMSWPILPVAHRGNRADHKDEGDQAS